MKELQKDAEPVQSEDKVLLILSYLGLFSLIPFFIAKNDYVKWHAKQGLTFCIVAFIAGIVIAIVSAILTSISIILGFLLSTLLGLVFLGIVVICILAIIKALNGIRWPIPFIADLSEKFFK
ncbi:MAG: DUF4870 domain-containing protein [Cystobacterineae bacterium]|nr:DUF4870 domain-containing protein [Cystobacterineae bacterium]